MKEAILMDPFQIKPKTDSFSETVISCLIIACITGVPVFYAVQSLTGNPNAWFFISVIPAIFLFWSNWIEMKRRERRAAFIDAYQFPASVKERAGKCYPHLSDEQLSLVMQGLRQYLKLCNKATRETISMPSRVVDVAWHEFILFTLDYEEFCLHGIGRFLHHTPAEAMASMTKAGDGMKKVWLLACEWEGIDQKSPSRLLFLFAIDAALNIPDGFMHSLDNDYAANGNVGCGGGGCGGCGGGC